MRLTASTYLLAPQCAAAAVMLGVAPAFAQNSDRFDWLNWRHIGWGVKEWWVVLTLPFLLGAILLALIIALITVRNRYRNQAVAAEVSEKYFADAVERLRLSEDDIKEIRSLLRFDPSVQPQVIFQSFDLFERCLHQRIAQAEARNLPPEEMANLDMELSALRRKLGYHYLPAEHPLVSSRNIVTGQTGSVFPIAGRSPIIHRASVIRNTERFFRINYDAEKEDPVRLAPGAKVRFVFSRHNDGFYGLTVPVVSFAARGTMDLGHTLEIKRSQMRQHVRVAADAPVKFRLIKTPDPQKSDVAVGEQHEGRMADISGGGMSFTFSKQLKAGDTIALSFTFCSESLAGITGKVIRVSLSKAQDLSVFMHHVQFCGIPASKQERIVRAVFERLRILSAWR